MHTPKSLPRLALVFLVLFTACQPMRTRKDTARALATELGITDANRLVEFDYCNMDGCRYSIYFFTPNRLTTDQVFKAFTKADAGSYQQETGTAFNGLNDQSFLGAMQEIAPGSFAIQWKPEATPPETVTSDSWTSREFAERTTNKASVEINYVSLETKIIYHWAGSVITQNIVVIEARR